VPIVARCGGLGFAVIVAGGGSERIISIRINTHLCPIRSRSAIEYGFQDTATIERILANALHAVGNLDACEATATSERIIFNARHAVSKRDARKATATIERRIANARHTVGDCDVCKAVAIIERIIFDCCNGIGNFKICNKYVV